MGFEYHNFPREEPDKDIFNVKRSIINTIEHFYV